MSRKLQNKSSRNGQKFSSIRPCFDDAEISLFKDLLLLILNQVLIYTRGDPRPPAPQFHKIDQIRRTHIHVCVNHILAKCTSKLLVLSSPIKYWYPSKICFLNKRDNLHEVPQFSFVGASRPFNVLLNSVVYAFMSKSALDFSEEQEEIQVDCYSICIHKIIILTQPSAIT